MNLEEPVISAGGIYKRYSSRLEKLNIRTFGDFLYHVPNRYDDFSKISKTRFAQVGDTVTIQGKVLEIKNEFTKSYKRIQTAIVEDDTGTIEVVWFNQPYLIQVIHQGDQISLSGKIGWFLRKKVMESPEYEILEGEEPIHTARLIPIYPQTYGISSKWLRKQIHKLLQEDKENIEEFLPQEILNRYHFLNLYDSLLSIHFPKFIDDVDLAKKRLAFDELLLLRLTALERKKEWEENLKGHIFKIEKYKKRIEDFWNNLPFELTGAQKKALDGIFEDLAKDKPMNRLLEGDVGSGKTVVSAIVMYVAFLNGFQSVIMAPTEILANQHFKTINELLSKFNLKIALATGSKKQDLEKFDILVGTHAVLSEKIKFRKLGLVVIDEQQRFGVEQRGIIREKGENPHVLTMTATPIPRTVALVMYGDLDISYLDEMPKGRKLIKTWLVPEEKRISGYGWIEKQIEQDKVQAFIVCPFIEESESMSTVKAATKEFETLKKVFKKLKLGMLHGKMKAKEKQEILKQFGERKIDILVATPVVEVGIDFPNATIMVIEAAERFGLSQLHQLRGRVGRGDKQSFCLLFTESKTELTVKRLKSLETMFVGAELAELDLKLRGPGELFGTAQHGLPQLKIAKFSDFVLIEETKKEAENIFPKINNHPKLKKKIEEQSSSFISPD